jgi:hypothetical protein
MQEKQILCRKGRWKGHRAPDQPPMTLLNCTTASWPHTQKATTQGQSFPESREWQRIYPCLPISHRSLESEERTETPSTWGICTCQSCAPQEALFKIFEASVEILTSQTRKLKHGEVICSKSCGKCKAEIRRTKFSLLSRQNLNYLLLCKCICDWMNQWGLVFQENGLCAFSQDS